MKTETILFLGCVKVILFRYENKSLVNIKYTRALKMFVSLYTFEDFTLSHCPIQTRHMYLFIFTHPKTSREVKFKTGLRHS